MIGFIALPLLLAGANALLGDLGAFLRRGLQPPAPSTSPVSNPYVPPFLGGQCTGGNYTVRYTMFHPSGGTFVAGIGGLTGAITSIGGLRKVGGFWVTTISDLGGSRTRDMAISFSADFYTTQPAFLGVIRNDGADSCGNLPDSSVPPPVPSDGLADSPPPVITGDDNLVMGAPIVALPSIGGLIAAAVAAAKAAGTALEALGAIADAIGALGDLLDKMGQKDKDKDKDDPSKKDFKYHKYGSIKKDGFLRLLPSALPEGFEPQYIDLQLLSIPIGYGKYFGSLSPNFYRFKSLGHISFVSPSFGILETHEIEFSRTSINIPPNCIGFYYHLGLEDIIRANVTMFYCIFTQGEE